MFNYTKLHIFDKTGAELPLHYLSDVRIHISGDSGEPALFYGLVGPDKTITGTYKISSGRFKTRRDRVQARISTPEGSTLVEVRAEMAEIHSSSDEPLYCIDSIDCSGTAPVIQDAVFPSITFKAKTEFEKVSTRLIETQTFYVLAEDQTGALVKPFYIEDEEWKSRYRLLFFIDCRQQKDFRIFNVNRGTDEVVWSDRVLLDFTEEESFRFHVGFTGADEGVYEEVLYACLIDTWQATDNEGDIGEVFPIGEIEMRAETEGEDERYRTLFTNFGVPDPKQFNEVYKDSAVGDDLTDNISLNKHSKEMFLSYSEIFPYVGTYKALIKAVRLLGYGDDVFFKEWYKILNAGPDARSGYVAYDMPYGSEDLRNVISSVPLEQRIELRKLNWLSMMYHLNRVVADGKYDRFGFPETVGEYAYYDEGMLLKLISLREWLEKYILGLNCRIIDIGGEGVYFERYRNDAYGGYQRHIEYEKIRNLTATVRDRSVMLTDSSANICVRIGAGDMEMTLEDCTGRRFSDYCDGYIGEDLVYREGIPPEGDHPEFIYVGKTVGGYDNELTFSLRASGVTDSFMFSDGYVDGNSPRVMANGSRIFFNPADLTVKEANAAFVNLPEIILERANLKVMDSAGRLRTKYRIYPVYGDEYSYCMENVFSGEKFRFTDRVTLVPPEFTDNEEYVTVTSKSGVSVTRAKHTDYRDMTDPSFGTADMIYNKNTTTYGFRYSTANASASPIFMILGYETDTPRGEAAPVFAAGEELALDITNGLLEFYENGEDRRVRLVFHTGENGVNTTEVSCTYESDGMQICTYDPHGEPFFHFTPGRDCSHFAELYENNPEESVEIDMDKCIRVSSAGVFSVDVIGRDLQNSVFAAAANTCPRVYAEEPGIETVSNTAKSGNRFEADGKLLSEEERHTLAAGYTGRSINEYAPLAGGITADGVKISYTIPQGGAYPPREGTHIHMVNLADKFEVISSSRRTDESGLVSAYDIVLAPPSRGRIMRTAGINDTKALSFIYTGSADSSGYEHASTGCGVIFDASAKGADTLDVYAVIYDELGKFPVLQAPGRLICEGLASGSVEDTHYHLIIENSIVNTYPSDDGVPAYRENGPMDEICAMLANPCNSLYVYPDWRAKIKIQGVSENRVYVSFTEDIFPRAFKPGEMVKLIFTVKNRPEYAAQSSYKVVGYDALGFVLILEGEISREFIAETYKRYAYAEIPSNIYSQGLYKVDRSGWTPSEKEDEDGWVNGWLCHRDSSTSDVFSPVFTHTCRAGDGMTEHSHNYRIPAGEYLNESGMPTIRYRVFLHDDIGCKSGEKADAMFNPFWEVANIEHDMDLYISYAHNIFADYDVRVKEVSYGGGRAEIITEGDPATRKKLRFADDTFRLDVRQYDYDEGSRLWMGEKDGTPLIFRGGMYSYRCPISLSGGDRFAVFSPAGGSYASGQIEWDVYKAMPDARRRLMFSSWNKDLFLDVDEPGVYDLRLTVFDRFGNKASRMFEGALAVNGQAGGETHEYRISGVPYSPYEGDSSYGEISGPDVYQEGDICTMKAKPGEGHTFAGWYINEACVSDKPVYTFRVERDMEFTARFEPFTYTVDAIMSGESENYGKIICTGGIDEKTFYSGSACTVASLAYEYPELPSITYVFDGLFEDASCTKLISDSSAYSFPVISDTVIYGRFSERKFSVTVRSNDTRLGTARGSGRFEAGSRHVINAKTSPYGEFAKWTENGRSLVTDPVSGSAADSSEYVIGALTRDYDVQANFEPAILDTYRLNFRMLPGEAAEYYDIYVNDTQANNGYDGSYGDTLAIKAIRKSEYEGQANYTLNKVKDSNGVTYNKDNVSYVMNTPTNDMTFSFTPDMLDTSISVHSDAGTPPGTASAEPLYFGEKLTVNIELRNEYEPDFITVNGVSYTDFQYTGRNSYVYTQDGVKENVTAVIYYKLKRNYEPFCVIPESDEVELHLANMASVHNTYMYSTNNAETWQDWNNPRDTSISVKKGEKLYICAKTNNIGCTGNAQTAFFSEQGEYSIGGNLISLQYPFGTDYDKAAVPENCFKYMFSNSAGLKNAESLIMPNSVARSCFEGMFEGTKIAKSPDLRAEDPSGADGCYNYMFRQCMQLDEVTVRLKMIHVKNEIHTVEMPYRYPYTKEWLPARETQDPKPVLRHNPILIIDSYDENNLSCVPSGWRHTLLN